MQTLCIALCTVQQIRTASRREPEEEHPPSPDSQPEQDGRQQTDQADQTGGRGTDPETGGIESCLGLRRAPDRSVFSLPTPIQLSPAVKKIGERGTKGRWVP